MINAKTTGSNIAAVFVAAIFARFGWEVGGWLIKVVHRIFS